MINLEYMRPYFKREPGGDGFVSDKVRLQENRDVKKIVKRAKEEVRRLAETADSILHPIGEAVVGGSSIAVGFSHQHAKNRPQADQRRDQAYIDRLDDRPVREEGHQYFYKKFKEEEGR